MWEEENFLKIAKSSLLRYLWVENFDEIAVSRTVKEIEANLCFAIFGKNSKIQNGHHFWVGENLWKLSRIHSSDTCGSKISTKLLYLTGCNILTYISSINTWASGDSPLAQLDKELELCLFLCVIRRLQVRDTAEPINNISLPTTRVKEIEANLCFAIFEMAAIFGEGKIF